MSGLTYEKSGVPHLKGDAGYNRKISQLVKSSKIPGVLGSSTGFASLFDIKKSGIKDPLLVTSTDGVGTKLEIAALQKKHDTIGIDLVAMCVNDLITCGAKPVTFLDYYATGRFHPKMTEQILKGIVKGCQQAGCSLVGGETAIMPGFYTSGVHKDEPQYDLAGFSVGLVERKRLIDGKGMRKGDVLLGVASSGFHSNGFSLLRKIFTKKELKGKIGKSLLTPTRIYVKAVQKVLANMPVSGISNITGGGLIDNLPRVIPRGLTASVESGAWKRPSIFKLVQDFGRISDFEMMRTFNLGIGLVIILKKKNIKSAQTLLKRMGIASWQIGTVVQGNQLEVQ